MNPPTVIQPVLGAMPLEKARRPSSRYKFFQIDRKLALLSDVSISLVLTTSRGVVRAPAKPPHSAPEAAPWIGVLSDPLKTDLFISSYMGIWMKENGISLQTVVPNPW